MGFFTLTTPQKAVLIIALIVLSGVSITVYVLQTKRITPQKILVAPLTEFTATVKSIGPLSMTVTRAPVFGESRSAKTDSIIFASTTSFVKLTQNENIIFDPDIPLYNTRDSSEKASSTTPSFPSPFKEFPANIADLKTGSKVIVLVNEDARLTTTLTARWVKILPEVLNTGEQATTSVKKQN